MLGDLADQAGLGTIAAIVAAGHRDRQHLGQRRAVVLAQPAVKSSPIRPASASPEPAATHSARCSMARRREPRGRIVAHHVSRSIGVAAKAASGRRELGT